MFKIAAFQGPSYAKDIQQSLHKITELLSFADTHNVDVLCMPEGYLHGYFETKEEALQYSMDLESAEFSILCSQLASYKTTLLLGLNEREGSFLYDTVVVIEQGRLLGKYRKTYVYHTYFTPGYEFPVFERKGIVYGIIICLDSLYFEPARILALKGAQILFCPMFNRTTLDYHFNNHAKLIRQKSHFIARSSENHVWLVASDIVWPYDGEQVCSGYASLYNAEGECLKTLEPFSEGVIMHEIPLEELKKRKMKRIIGHPKLMNILQQEYVLKVSSS